jgi:hypothetical protein
MPSQEEINKTGLAYIATLRGTVHALWVKMCEEDGIDPKATFVVFSDTNKYKPFYDKAMSQLWEAEAQYKAGGYVGLKIERR